MSSENKSTCLWVANIPELPIEIWAVIGLSDIETHSALVRVSRPYYQYIRKYPLLLHKLAKWTKDEKATRYMLGQWIYQTPDGGPSAIYADGTQYWYKDGKIHRDSDLPAIIYSNGSRHWYQNGKCHRDGDLPAAMLEDGTQFWYKNWKIHRDGDFPAVIHAYGMQEWYKSGELHRDGDLPAVLHADGTKEWYSNGVRYYPNM